MPTTDSNTQNALSPKQVDWLSLITGDDIATWEATTQAREEKLSELRNKVGGLKGRLDASFDYTLVGKDGSWTRLWIRHSDISSKDKEGQDSLNELDVVHDDLSNVQGIQDKDAFDVGLAYQELEDLQKELQQAVGPDGKPLFTDQDIMRELYTPLVREGVMSENQVPDKYSEVANVFNQSSALYNKRLEEYSANRTSVDDFKDKLRFASGIVEDASSIAGPITKMVGSEQAQNIVKGVAIGLQAGIKVTENVVDRALLDGVDTVANAVGDIVSLFVGKSVGSLVKKGISAGTAGTKAIRAIQEGDYVGALTAIGEGITAATAVADPKGKNGAKGIGEHVGFAFSQAGNVGAFIKAVQAKDPAQISAALGNIAKSSVSHYTGTLKVDKPEKELTEEDKAHNNRVDGLTQTINSSIDIGAAATKTTQGVVQGDVDMTLEGVGELGKAALGVVGGEEKRKTGDDSRDTDITLGQNLTDVGTHGAKALAQRILGNKAKFLTELVAMGQSGRDTLIDRLADNISKAIDELDEDDEEAQALKEELEEAKETLEAMKEEALVEEEKLNLIKKGLGFEDPTEEELEEAEEGLKELEKAGNLAELDEATREFKSMLELSVGGMDPEMDPEARKVLAEQFDIDKLITQMQMDQAVLSAAESIFDVGLDIASVVVPQIAAMKAGKEFLKNVVIAAQRAIELNKFVDSLDDASSAVSAYADAIKKRVKDTRTQLADHTIEAIIQAAIAVGAALASTGAGPIAGAGAVVQKTAEASKGVKALITRIASEAELSRAWNLYQQALANPLDRKIKRMAMAANPTLSKYAIAYGAYIQGDAIAKDIVRKCGLSEEVLASASTNVDKVVKYLEVRFSEDKILLRTVAVSKKWLQGKPVEITMESWMQIKALAISDAELVAGSGEGRIERYLIALDASDYRTKTFQDTPPEDVTGTYIDLLKELQGALSAYKPLDKKKAAHEDMGSIGQELLGKALQEQQMVEALA